MRGGILSISCESQFSGAVSLVSSVVPLSHTFVRSATTSCIPKRSNNVEPWSMRAASVQTSTRPWTAVWYIGTIFEHHKVGSSSQIVRVLLGISAREQAGVTTDLAQDPTLVSRLLHFPIYIYSFLDSRRTPTLLAQTAVMNTFSDGQLSPFFLVGA